MPQFEINFDEKNVTELIKDMNKQTNDETKSRELINKIQSTILPPLKTIMLELALFHDSLEPEAKISGCKNASPYYKYIYISLIGGIISSSMNEFNFNENEIKKMIEQVLIQHKNIEKQTKKEQGEETKNEQSPNIDRRTNK